MPLKKLSKFFVDCGSIISPLPSKHGREAVVLNARLFLMARYYNVIKVITLPLSMVANSVKDPDIFPRLIV